MNHYTLRGITRIAWRPHQRAVRCAAGLIASGLLLAGCGATSPAASSTTAKASQSTFSADALAFAGCMRSHGAAGYPDPQVSSSNGQVHLKITPGRLDPNTPAFNAASDACHSLLPDDGAPADGTSAQQKAQDLKFADCMRSHGVRSFPDPSRDGAFDLPHGLNPLSPPYSQAAQACRNVQPRSLSINQS